MDFLSLFNDVPESLVVVSPDYTVLAATDTYLKVTRRNREEIMGLHFLKEAFPEKEIPYDQNPVKLALDETLTSKKPTVMEVIRYDLAIPAEEGGGFRELYWETSYTPGLDGDGNVRYIIQKAVDVTERELAKRAHLESETKFKSLTDAIPQLVYTADSSGNLTYINDRWSRYTGIPQEEALADGSAWLEAVHPEDREPMLKKAQESFATGEDFQMEIRIRSKAGEYRWFMTKSTPVRMKKDGKALMWVGSSTDIHTNKLLIQEMLEASEQMSQLSDQVQAAYQKAEAERKTLERLIMEAPAVFCTLKGPDHRFELVNPYYQGLFPGKQLAGRTVAEALPEVIEQGFIEILDNVYQGTPFVAKDLPVKLDRDASRELQETYFTLTYQPIYDGDGKVIGILVFGYETTETMQMKKALQALQAKQV